jgi:putative peptidoglycan lipid II flippase
MVNRLLSFFNRKISGLHEAAYLLALFTFLSQLLALVRDRMLAHFFGAGATLDIYYAAFRIPDIIFVSVASVVSLSVLIPFLVERIDRDVEEAKRFVNSIFSWFSVSIVAVSGIVFFLVPFITHRVFPGISDPASRRELILLTRILLLSPIFLGVSNFLASITQAYKRFFVYAVSPILYNLGIISGVIFFYPRFGLAGLAVGVVAGAVMHLAVQLPSVWHVGFFPRFVRPDFREMRQVVAVSLPRTLALSTTQLLLLFLVALASLQAAGSIAVFNLSFNLQSVPMAVVGVSYSLAAFPTLSKLFARGERGKFIEAMTTSARHIIFWSFPALVLFVVLRAQIVRTVLGSGQFGWESTRLTAAALAIFALSTIAQSLVLLFVRGYYAAGNTRKPLVVNLISAGVVVACSYLFLAVFTSVPFIRYFIESLLKVDDVPGTSILMLPASYSIGTLLNGAVLWGLFERDFGGFTKNVLPTLLHSLASSVVMGFVAYHSLGLLDGIIKVDTAGGIFLQGLLSGSIGIAAGIALLRLMGNREVTEIWLSLHARIWKAKAIAPEQREL